MAAKSALSKEEKKRAKTAKKLIYAERETSLCITVTYFALALIPALLSLLSGALYVVRVPAAVVAFVIAAALFIVPIIIVYKSGYDTKCGSFLNFNNFLLTACHCLGVGLGCLGALLLGGGRANAYVVLLNIGGALVTALICQLLLGAKQTLLSLLIMSFMPLAVLAGTMVFLIMYIGDENPIFFASFGISAFFQCILGLFYLQDYGETDDAPMPTCVPTHILFALLYLLQGL